MSILAWIVVGLIAGWLAKVLSPGLEPGGFIATLLIGVFGAFLGGWLFSAFGYAAPGGANLYSILVAAIGALVTLTIWKSVAGTRNI